MAKFKVLTVTAFDEFPETISKARQLVGATREEECFFRGHSNKGYHLLPTLQRMSKEQAWSKDTLLSKEDALFWEFQARAHELHSTCVEDWDYLFAMRHHHVPTRLLDWTESLAVALYFAVSDEGSQNISGPCIWVLNPYALNEESEWGRDLVAPRYLGWDSREKTYYTYGDLVTERLIDWEWPVAIYPMQRQARMRAQRGWFTIHGTDPGPIEEIAPTCVVRIDFDGESIAQTRDLLALLGFDDFNVYTDLDALARSLNAKNFPKRFSPPIRGGRELKTRK